MSLKIQPLVKEQILNQEEALSSAFVQPLSFVRGLNPKSLHRNLLCTLSDKSDGGKNLCFQVNDGSNQILILAEYLSWDSEHFGFGMAKIHHLLFSSSTDSYFITKAVGFFVSEATRLGVEYILCSQDLRSRVEIQSLCSSNFVPIEFRTHYHRSIKDFSYSKRFNVRLAEKKDLEALIHTAVNSENPNDRFFGDPTLDRVAVKEMMQVWINKSVTTSFADGVLVPDMKDPKAFCTFKTHQSHWDEWGIKVSQPILAAVSPELKGWYIKIMSEINFYLRDLGADTVYMTTQLGNLPVIRCWEALNFSYGGSEIVLRWTSKLPKLRV